MSPVDRDRGIILDLDDTLYARDQFVRGGLAAVARHVEQDSGIPAHVALQTMRFTVAAGQPRFAFQALCLAHGLSEDGIPVMLDVYRTHQPLLSLTPGVKGALGVLREFGWRLVILTNGLPSVQMRKVEALDLAALVDEVIYAEDETPGGKPAAAAFRVALGHLGVPAQRCVCVGDDLLRDIAGARALGMFTIRVTAESTRHQPPYSYCPTTPAYAPGVDADADAIIDQFSELPGVAAALINGYQYMLHDIGGRTVGPSGPVFVIAEIGLNHGGSVARAIEMVDAAAWAGASAVKLQTIVADQLVAPSCPPPAHVHAASLREFFATFQLDADGHRAIVHRARDHGLAVLTSPFTEEALPMLEMLNLDAYKIASGDLTNPGLIEAVARTGRPLIISTGMGTLQEVVQAMGTAREAGNGRLAALHCVSAYPTPPASQNVRAVATLAAALQVPVGLSDHGADASAAPLAVALGACIYERHFVLDGDDTAIDAAVSSTPDQLKAAIAAMARARIVLGDGRKTCQPAELANILASRRGLYARRTIRAGQQITALDVIALRPASGMSPADLPVLLGSVLRRRVDAGDAFHVSDLFLERAS